MTAIIDARWEIKQFAAAMERQMQKHDADRGEEWKDCVPGDLVPALKAKLNAVLACKDKGQSDLLADLANYAMMIWSMINPNWGEVV